MAFSADAIGFYLQAEDQLSPVLAGASSNYDKYVSAMEKSNKRLFDSTSGALAAVGKLVKSIEATPQAVASAYTQVLKTIQSKAKAVSQPINLVFTAKDKKALARELAGAVNKALAGARIRLGASFPARKLGMFDTTYALRTLYGSLAQPPDMRGTLQPKKYAEGGVVDGPRKGFDSVLSLLQPGEMVLPKDVSDKLLEAASAATVAGVPANVTQALADVDNLSTGLGNLKGSIEAGLGSYEDIAMYRRGVQALASQVDNLTEMSSTLSFNTRVALAGSIKQATGRMQEFTESGEHAGTVFEKLLSRVIGPARFLAISKAADKLANTFSELQGRVSSTFSEIGGDQTESFVTNMNQMNRILGLSRDRLREFKVEAGELSIAADLNVNEMSEALEGMAEAGLRDLDVMLRLAPAVTSMAAGSTANVNSLGAAAYQMTDAFEFSEGRIGVVFENIRRFSSVTASSADDAVQGMSERFARIGPVLERVTEDQGARILTSIQALGAATADNWAGSVDTIPDILAEVLARSEDGLQKAALVFGSTPDEIEARLQRGDLQGILGGIGQQVQALVATNNLQGLQALQEALSFEGTTQQFAKLGTNMDSINAKLGELGEMALAPDQAGAALDSLGQAARNNRTAFEEFQAEMGQLTAKQLPFLDFSVAEVIDGIKEFGPTSILAIGMLAKMGVGALATGGKLLGLGKVFGKLGGVMSFGKAGAGAAGALSSVATSTTAVAGAAGAGGFFATLTAGLTALAGGVAALGVVLISPPGIAFTVTLIVALLALAAAARIATPALKVLGDVVESAMGSAVDAFAAAVPFFQTFVETAGAVFLGALDRMVLVFDSLTNAEPGNLLRMAPALVSVAGGLAALAGSVVALGVAFGGAALGVGAFRVASGGGELSMGLAGALDAIVGDFGTMAAGPAMIDNAKKQTFAAVGFVDAYGILLDSIEALPGGGLLSGVFGDDPAERIRKHATSIARAVKAMQVDFAGATALRQRNTEAAFTPAQIDTVINAVAEAGLNDDVRDEMMENNRLLRSILEALNLRGEAKQEPPQRTVAGPTRGSNPLTQDLGGFNI